MSWNINFKVVNGKVDTESIAVSGTPPEGTVYLSGHDSATSRSFGLGVNGASISASIPVVAPETKE